MRKKRAVLFKTSAYEILGIESENIGDVKKKYLELVRKYPPENAPEMFMKIREAYDNIAKFQRKDSSIDFVLYKSPQSVFDVKKESKKKMDKDILKDVFETPFKTETEVQKLIKNDTFKK